MSAISQQAWINPDKSLFVNTTTPTSGSVTFTEGNGITFQTGISTNQMYGSNGDVWIVGDAPVAIGRTNTQPAWYVDMNATVQSLTPGMYVSSLGFFNNGILVPQGPSALSNATISSINGLEQNPTATRFGFYTQNAGGSGTTSIANSNIKASSIVMVQMFGSQLNLNSTYTISANPIAGIGFTSIFDRALGLPQPMSYYVAKW